MYAVGPRARRIICVRMCVNALRCADYNILQLLEVRGAPGDRVFANDESARTHVHCTNAIIDRPHERTDERTDERSEEPRPSGPRCK